MAIERFISRRGPPSIIWSDNGTNFVGAGKEVLPCIKNWNAEAPLSLVHKSIKWKYNPPSAQHQSEAWERMVRSCKRVFYAILGSRKLTNEILSTTMCLAEGSLSARPLTHVSDDPDSLEPTLNEKVKWHAPSEYSLKTGDIVWLVKSTSPRGHYPLARTMSLNYGKDNTARCADLRTVSGNYTRPLVELVPVLAPSWWRILMIHSNKVESMKASTA